MTGKWVKGGKAKHSTKESSLKIPISDVVKVGDISHVPQLHHDALAGLWLSLVVWGASLYFFQAPLKDLGYNVNQ